MAAEAKTRAAASNVTVAAAIVDVTDRVLGIQRAGDRWLLPSSELASDESLGLQLRQCVRTTTGFEVKELSVAGVYKVEDGLAVVVRCRIKGVGSDITSDTRSLRWMDREAIRAEITQGYAQGMLDALDAEREPVVIEITDEPIPALLAS